jgi:hypothetical protein
MIYLEGFFPITTREVKKMCALNMSIERYPDWYQIERDTEKIIKKLNTIKELIPYLNNSDEYIRRLSIIRVNELRLKDSIVALKELLDDPLESSANKELCAWTIKVVSEHWNTDLFITSKYLNNYSGKEKYEDVFKVIIKDTLPSLRFDFTASMLNTELNIESTDIRSSRDIEIDLPFSVKEWFGQYSQDIIADLKALIIKLPILLFRGLKLTTSFILGGLIYIFKALIGYIHKLKSSLRTKRQRNNTQSNNMYDQTNSPIHKYSATNLQASDFQSLRDSYNKTYYENSYKEKITLSERIKGLFLSIAYIIFAPIRFIIQHKKLSSIGLVLLYCFLCFFPSGKALTYKYIGLDLMDEQAKAFYATKEIISYAWEEVNEILDISTTPQSVVAQTDSVPSTEPELVDEQRYIVIAQSGLNLREEPDASSKRLIQLPFESVVTKEDEKGIWFKITTLDGLSGWVSSKYLKEYRGD